MFEGLATLGKSELPKECDAIFVLGPVKAFSQDESAALKRYLEAGGNLLLALDPVIDGEQIAPTGLEGLAQSCVLGVLVVVQDDLLVHRVEVGHSAPLRP